MKINVSKKTIFVSVTLISMILASILFIKFPKEFIFHLITTFGFEIKPDQNIPFPSGYEKLDDYFAVQKIDQNTYAILEYQYWQKNVVYLIIGKNKAVLFDTGSGYGGLKKLVSQLTELPIEVVISHLHYDHLGRAFEFDNVKIFGDEINFKNTMRIKTHYGESEKKDIIPFQVTTFLKPNEVIELGDRNLQVIHLSGHTDDSIALIDKANSQIFIGDFTNEGPMIFFTLQSSVKKTLFSSKQLIKLLKNDVAIFPAHLLGPHTKLDKNHLVQLELALEELSTRCEWLCYYFKPSHIINEHSYLTYPFLWSE